MVAVSPWLTLAVSMVGVILIPLGVLLYRIVVRATEDRDELRHIREDLGELVKDKDRVHLEMLKQLTADRDATDKRLRWLEEHLWAKRR